jgi:two-component system response regulator CpxR
MAVISVFSGAYCKEDAVIQSVAQELGYAVIDDRIMEETSGRYNVPIERLQRSFGGPDPLLNKFTHEREKHISYLRIVLAELIQPDNVIIRGCAGHLLPRTMGHVLRVCLIANHDFRVREATQHTGKSEKDAGKLIQEHDKRNFECTEYFFDKPAYDPTLYDLVMPMHDRSEEQAAKEICDLVRSKPLRTTDRCGRAAEDFVLSANVALALAAAGLAADVHSEGGQVVLSINRYVVRLEHYRERITEVASGVSGVKSVSTRLGPRYRAPSLNPWGDIEGLPKFMLVDDEKEFVHTLSERLRSRDLESSIAYDGEQALEMLNEKEVDVIVLDLMMPGIDGIETLRRVKRDHPKVEVIILTGHGSDYEKSQAEELGAHAYLRKPVDIDILARVMREAYARAKRANADEPGGTAGRRDDEK